MDNPLVEHLKENGPGGGRKGLASVVGVVTPAFWRRVALRVRQRPVARVCLGLLVAFACGVGLGVGVAAMIAPQEQRSRSVAEASGGAPGIASSAMAGPVVAVTVREDNDAESRPQSATVEASPGKKPADIALSNTESAAPDEMGPKLAYAVDLIKSPARQKAAAPIAEKAAPSARETNAPKAAVEGDLGSTKFVDAVGPVDAQQPTPADVPVAAPAASRNTDVDLGPSLKAVKGPLEPAENSETVTVKRAEQGPASNQPPVVADASAGLSAESEAPISFDGAETVSEAATAAVASLTTPADPVTPTDPVMSAGLTDRGVANGNANGVDRGAEQEIVLPPRPARKNLQLAALPVPRTPAWIRNAVTLPEKPRNAMIAIIVDDMGIDQKRSKAIIDLSARLTLSFIPYGYNLEELTDAARVAGHEIMLHQPMEPLDPEANPGPKALMTTVSVEENRQRLLWALSRLDGIVGINNHMGSKFTTWLPGMEMVMEEVAARGLLFVDSFTHNESVGFMLARRSKLPTTARDVFIDHDIDTQAIERRLRELESVARRRGHAIGIAHPHDLTREALEWWIVDAQARGFDFVPVSHIIRRGMKSG